MHEHFDPISLDVGAAVSRVRDALSPDLLAKKWRRAAETTGNRYSGHCYAASEALYHMLGGAGAGWVPQVLSSASWPAGLKPGETHWFIRNRRTGAVIDPTEDQFFPLKVPHDHGKGSGFLTRHPSKRGRKLIERVLTAIEAEDAPFPEESTGYPSASM